MHGQHASVAGVQQLVHVLHVVRTPGEVQAQRIDDHENGFGVVRPVRTAIQAIGNRSGGATMNAFTRVIVSNGVVCTNGTSPMAAGRSSGLERTSSLNESGK